MVVDGDGDTDLDIFIYDQNGYLVAYDDDYSDYCVASWRPRWSGVYRVVIVNHGRVYNRYRLSTN